jgi:hypothetical protein
LAPLSHVTFCIARLWMGDTGWPAYENVAVSVNSRANQLQKPYKTSFTSGSLRNRYPSGHANTVTNTTV